MDAWIGFAQFYYSWYVYDKQKKSKFQGPLFLGIYIQVSFFLSRYNLWCLARINESFIRVSYAFNKLPHKHLLLCGNIFKRREKMRVSCRQNSLDSSVFSSKWWVLELNIYETKEWNYALRVVVLSIAFYILVKNVMKIFTENAVSRSLITMQIRLPSKEKEKNKV